MLEYRYWERGEGAPEPAFGGSPEHPTLLRMADLREYTLAHEGTVDIDDILEARNHVWSELSIKRQGKMTRRPKKGDIIDILTHPEYDFMFYCYDDDPPNWWLVGADQDYEAIPCSYEVYAPNPRGTAWPLEHITPGHQLNRLWESSATLRLSNYQAITLPMRSAYIMSARYLAEELDSAAAVYQSGSGSPLLCPMELGYLVHVTGEAPGDDNWFYRDLEDWVWVPPPEKE